jgi:FkbM family methyltransferase
MNKRTLKIKKKLFLDIYKTKGFKRLFKEYNNIINYTKHYKIKDNDVVLDIGAYHGWFSIYNTKFYCLEIDPVNYFNLKKLVLNDLKSNIFIFNIGVWSYTGTSKLYGDRVGSMGSRINYKNKRKNKSVLCKVTTLEDFVKENKIKKIDFIKMDVEGAEIEILESSKNFLKKYKPTLSIASYHVRNSEKTYLKIEQILKEIGYNVFTDNQKHLTTYATKL